MGKLLFYHTVGFSGWVLCVGRYRDRGAWQGRKWGLVKSVAEGWLYIAQIKEPTSPVAPSPDTYQSLCFCDLIFTAHRPLYGQKKRKSSREELPYLPNNLAKKASISHLRPNLAFPQRIHSLSVCQGLQLVLGQITRLIPHLFLSSGCSVKLPSFPHLSREE